MTVLPEGPFDLICADPAWQYVTRSDKGRGRSAERHYATMTIEEICALPVSTITSKHCLLMLWITAPEVVRGTHCRVLDAWGFGPSTMGFVWLKPNRRTLEARQDAPPLSPSDFFMGMGYLTRQNAEFVVFGRKGNPPRVSRSVHQIILAARREHSRKPDEFYREAERLVGHRARKLDMFAREERPGWVSWGNETTKFGDPV